MSNVNAILEAAYCSGTDNLAVSERQHSFNSRS